MKNTTISKGYTSFEDLFLGRSQNRFQVGTGSGVIISPDGYIITNNHVIDGAESIEITTNNNKTYKAEIVGSDASTDIALLKVDSDEELNYATFGDSNSTKVGEWVLAMYLTKKIKEDIFKKQWNFQRRIRIKYSRKLQK